MTHFSNGDRLSDTQVFSGSRRDGVGLGKSNTEKIVEKMDIDGLAYSVYGNNKTTEKYAAKECMDYSIVNDGITFDDWFLPSDDELYHMLKNLGVNEIGLFDAVEYSGYWSSTEYDYRYSGGKTLYRYNPSSSSSFYQRDRKLNVRPVRYFI